MISGNRKSAGKAKSPKLTEAAKVDLYMRSLDHPLKKEIEFIRNVIRKSSADLTERIKWNAPSYYYLADLLTFNFRSSEKVLLVFHHESIVKIVSPLLEGDYKDRRLMYFTDMADAESKKNELERIIKEYVNSVRMKVE